MEKSQANYQIITFHGDIFSQTVEAITASEKYISELFAKQDGKGLDLIVIGPIESRSEYFTSE